MAIKRRRRGLGRSRGDGEYYDTRDAGGKFSRVQGFKVAQVDIPEADRIAGIKSKRSATAKNAVAKRRKSQRYVDRDNFQTMLNEDAKARRAGKPSPYAGKQPGGSGGPPVPDAADVASLRDRLDKPTPGTVASKAATRKALRAKSIADAETASEAADIFTAKTGIATVDFDHEHLDADAAKSFLGGIEEMHAKYPDTPLKTVGVQHHPDQGTTWFGLTTPLDPSKIDGSRSSISLNPVFSHYVPPEQNNGVEFDGVTKAFQSMNFAVERGFHPEGHEIDPYRSTAIHEYGHALTFGAGMHTGVIRGWINELFAADLANERDIMEIAKEDDRITSANLSPVQREAARQDLVNKLEKLKASWVLGRSVGYSIDMKDPDKIQPFELLATAFADVELEGKGAKPFHQQIHAKMMSHLAKRDQRIVEKPDGAGGFSTAALEAPEVEPAMVPVGQYGMSYDRSSWKTVERARSISDKDWEKLPVETIGPNDRLIANEKEVKRKHIDKIVNGTEDFRDNYTARLWRDANGDLHVVDGHTRVSMYRALGRDMPVQIMDEAEYRRIKARHNGYAVAPLQVPDFSNEPKEYGGTGDQKYLLEPPPEIDGVPEDYDPNSIKSLLTEKAYDEPEDDSAFVNGVGYRGTENDYLNVRNKADDLSEEEKDAAWDQAEAEFLKACAAGAEQRAIMREVIPGLGGALAREFGGGRPTAVKTKFSMYRKVMDKYRKGVKNKKDFKMTDITLDDGVRFTAVFSDNDYWEKTNALVAELESRGYTTEEFAPGWSAEAYRGINLKMVAPDGVVMEMQVHTPYSVYAAEGNHKVYETTRESWFGSVVPEDIQDKYNERMKANVEKIPIPRGVPILADRKDTYGAFVHEGGLLTYEDARKRIEKGLTAMRKDLKAELVTGNEGSVMKSIPNGGKQILPKYKTNAAGKQSFDVKGTWADIDDEDLRENWRAAMRAASPSAVDAGKRWYDEANEMCDFLMAKYGKSFEDQYDIPMTKELMAGLMSIFSANNGWVSNLVDLRMYLDGEMVRRIGTPSPTTGKPYQMGMHHDKLGNKEGDQSALSLFEWLQDERGTVEEWFADKKGAPKPYNFFGSIFHQNDDDDFVAGDRWVSRIMLHTDDDTFAEKMVTASSSAGGQINRYGYARMKRIINEIAKEPEFAGLRPEQIQAIPWIHVVGPDGAVGYAEDLRDQRRAQIEIFRKLKERGWNQ